MGEAFLTRMFSFIVPCYNCSNTIQAFFDSIVKNSGSASYEMVFVDDGSTDDTIDCLERIKTNNPDINIKIVSQTNLGPGSARNNGLSHSSGEFVVFLDSDDCVNPGFLSLLQNGVLYDFCFSSYRRITGNNKNKKTIVRSDFVIGESSIRLLSDFICGKVYISLWNSVFSKAIIDKHNIRFKDGCYVGEDVLFILEYLSYCDRVHYVDSLSYDYYFDLTKSEKRLLDDFTASVESSIYWPVYLDFKKRELSDCVLSFEKNKFPIFAIVQLTILAGRTKGYKDFKNRLTEMRSLLSWVEKADSAYIGKRQYAKLRLLYNLLRVFPALFYFVSKRRWRR